MNDILKEYIDGLENNNSDISNERHDRLRELSDFIRTKLQNEKSTKLTFICTHNSRRSHLCQIWAATLAVYHGLEGVETYSGGTEATAFNPRAVQALRRAGFKIENPDGDNPRYKVSFDDESDPMLCFSKTFDNPTNPQQYFAAVMTCSDADQNCPVVPGSDNRFSIPYQDPKESDGTPEEAQVYDERCRQIAAEMYFVMSQV